MPRWRRTVLARDLRARSTGIEKHVWGVLRNRQMLGYKFRRQHPIGPFIADFYCAELRLVIELDGSVHGNQREYDAARSAWLAAAGYRVVRFENHRVSASELGKAIEREIERSPSPHGGEGDRG